MPAGISFQGHNNQLNFNRSSINFSLDLSTPFLVKWDGIRVYWITYSDTVRNGNKLTPMMNENICRSRSRDTSFSNDKRASEYFDGMREPRPSNLRKWTISYVRSNHYLVLWAKEVTLPPKNTAKRHHSAPAIRACSPITTTHRT